MNKPRRRDSSSGGPAASAWMVIGAAVVLTLVVMVLAAVNVNREKANMSRILLEKGGALIRALEAGARTGMMGGFGSGVRLQNLLEETATLPDVLYLAVTNENGRIVACGDRSQIGGAFVESAEMRRLAPSDSLDWRIVEDANGTRSFMVFREFIPLGRERPPAHPRPRPHDPDRPWAGNPNPDQRRPWCGQIDCLAKGLTANKPIIFVGLDVAPFEAARTQDVRNSLVISAVLLLLGLAGVVGLQQAERRRVLRRELQHARLFADEVVSNMPVGLVAVDGEGRISMVNREAQRMVRLDPDLALGQPAENVLPSALRERWEAVRQSGHAAAREVEVALGPETVPLSLVGSRVVSEQGAVIGDILLLDDLRQVRRLQEEIRRKDRLAAIGNLAAGVAHEIRNPLSSIKGTAAFFAQQFEDGSDGRRMAEIMVKEVERLNRVITELLELARPSDLSPRRADLAAVVERSLDLASQDAPENVAVELQRPPGELWAVFDPDRLTQALLNLYLNAFQAMELGGRLDVLVASEDGQAGPVARIDIRDTGRGMDASTLARMFNPYFTTRPQGTGLGLAITHNIVQGHAGEISAASAPGQGTTVTLRLPLGEAHGVET